MEKLLKCLIVDDEPLARSLIRRFVESQKDLQVVGECKDGGEVSEWLSEHQADIIFLDIQMPKMTGITVAEDHQLSPLIIFTTAYEQFAAKAFELSVLDYLVKPFSEQRFLQAVDKARTYYQWRKHPNKASQTFLFVRSEYQLKKIAMTDILFIEGMKEYVKIHLKDQLPELVYMRMKDLIEKLNEDFLRIHKSYIVNLTCIDQMGSSHLTIGKRELKVGRTYKKRFQQWLQQQDA
ncbi:MAG: LytTR family DNA-binding domain-containing protein [Bacteroidota bacterium]